MLQAIISHNGSISPFKTWDEPKISAFDRSYLYGDSIYEVIRTRGRQPFLLDEHLRRLKASCSLMRLNLEKSRWPVAAIAGEVTSALQAFFERFPNFTDAYCRMVLSRGAGKIGFGLPNLQTDCSLTVYVLPLQDFQGATFEKGLRLNLVDRVRNSPRALDPAMKSGNYLNNLLATLEAHEAGFDDAILCDSEGFVTEGSTFNIAYFKRGVLVTSPLDVGILEGITRDYVLKTAAQAGIPVRVVRFERNHLYEADEVFLTSTLKDVFPIVQIDKVRYCGGKPGPQTRRLSRLFQEWIHEVS